jgi:hypothetical protein
VNENTMANFQMHFGKAKIDRKSTASTGTTGYQGAANQAENTTPTNPIANQAQVIAVTIVLAALKVVASSAPCNTRGCNQQDGVESLNTTIM